MTFFIIIVIIATIVLIANNTAGDFVRRDDERRRFEAQKKYDELINTRLQADQARRDQERYMREIYESERLRRRQSTDYISDAEIIEETKD